MHRLIPLALAAALAAPLAATAAPATYAVDPTHTAVTFEILHFGTSTNRGRFQKNTGTVTLDTTAKTGKVDLTLDMAGINTGVPAFDKHLKSADFFDAEKHPTATFVGSDFSFDGDKVTAVRGQLTLRGATHPVTLKAVRFNCFDHPMLKRQVCGGDFQATIKRSQWGISYGMPNVAPDDVSLIIQIEAIKQ